jgi:esterase/lipase
MTLKYKHFIMEEHGFVGHLAEPDKRSDKAVIVIMGGEQSLLPGIKFAERFADYGITGLAVSLFGAEGLPDSISEVPLEMFIPAVNYLKNEMKIEHISVYGQSMGSIFAVLAAQYIGGIENLIMVSPTHVPFEGTEMDRKTMTGKSIATFQGRDIPFVPTDFGIAKSSKYYKHSEAKHRVMGMWIAFYNAYQNKEKEKKAWLHLEKTNARILLIAGAEDEAWPAEYSVNVLKTYLDDMDYAKDVKVIVYPHGSHLNGLMPNRQREKKLYRMIPFIGLMYKTFGKYRKENMEYFEQTEQEIINWIG